MKNANTLNTPDETPPAADPALEELNTRRMLARQMGGPDAIERQHALGKMTARERVDTLLDPGTFREMGSLTGKARYDEAGQMTEFTPSNAVIGTGRIDGVKVSVSADDFTIRGGSSESTNSDKWVYAERYAYKMRMPLVRLVDTAGGSVKLLEQQQSTKIPGYSTWPMIPLLTEVPVVGIAMGACAGLGALKVIASHFSIMVKGSSQVFAAGPPVVKQAFGVDIDKEALGGYRVHSRKSGIVDNEAEDEADALRQARRFLSYMPRSSSHKPPRIASEDPSDRADPWLREAVPADRRKVFDTRKILASIFDRDSIFEIGRYHGGSTITALARLDGHAVAVMASDPRVSAGAMTLRSANKIERFIELCDTFHLPVVHLVDQPGNMTGLEAESEGTLMGAVRLGKAIELSTMPWMSVILRRAFGLAGGLHGRKGGIDGRELNHRVAWPTARWGSIPIEGGVAAAYRRDIAEAEDPQARRDELEAYYGRLASPYRTAERFGIVDIIDPAETRSLLCDWVEDAYEVLL